MHDPELEEKVRGVRQAREERNAYELGRGFGEDVGYWGLLLLTAAIVAGLLLFFTCDAFAQEPCAPEYQGTRRAQIDHEGQPGFWFARPVGKCLLADVGELRVRRENASLFDLRLTIRDEQMAGLREMVELSKQAEERAVGVVDAAERRARRAEAERDAWYRSPTLWMFVGVVTTVTVELVVILLVPGG